jgi:L-ribulose-5-phosphate 4-epimerase
MLDLHQQIKAEIAACARRAYEIRLQTGNGGNLSARVPGTNWVVIKSSGCSFEECTVDNLITVDLQGQKIDGNGVPSSELLTHLAIYDHRPSVQAVFHCHSPWAIACANLERFIPAVTMHARSKLGRIPVIDLTGEGTPELALASAINQILEQNPETIAFVQSKHGIFSMAETITRARYHAELVEETAQIAWLTQFIRHLPTEQNTHDC